MQVYENLLRWFCRVYWTNIPDASTFLRRQQLAPPDHHRHPAGYLCGARRSACPPVGSFDITRATGKVQEISHRFCTTVQCVDGYNYQKGEEAFPPIA